VVPQHASHPIQSHSAREVSAEEGRHLDQFIQAVVAKHGEESILSMIDMMKQLGFED
jgi:hypothetical protein